MLCDDFLRKLISKSVGGGCLYIICYQHISRRKLKYDVPDLTKIRGSV